MKNQINIALKLDQLLDKHYYSEPYELTAAVKEFERSICLDEKKLLKAEIIHRVLHDPSIVNIEICNCWHLPEVLPTLVKTLNNQLNTSQLTRSIMNVLQHYSDMAAYLAVERFMDSAQEHEVLFFLSRMDYSRTIPHLKKAMKKDHMLSVCLHILFERKKSIGLDTFIEELKSWTIAPSYYWRERLRLVFNSKKGEYNPFEVNELRAVLEALDEERG